MATTGVFDKGHGEAGSLLNAEKVQVKDVFDIKIVALIVLGLAPLYIGFRLFQGTYGWSAGLDSNSAEFATVWMQFFYAEIAVEGAVGTALLTWLWRTRDKALDAIRPGEELKRYFRLLYWLFAYTFAVYWAGSFFAEQDASWHQTVIRDTSFTPSHIVLFYAAFPIYIIIGLSSFLYARTRLPQFAKRVSIPFVLAIVGPFMILPNVGLNEWGHTFWFMEEWFSAPLHWGFVVFGWTALALGGLVLQLVARMGQLMGLASAMAEKEA
jgi:methane/ammonia monooxygenase subunit C